MNQVDADTMYGGAIFCNTSTSTNHSLSHSTYHWSTIFLSYTIYLSIQRSRVRITANPQLYQIRTQFIAQYTPLKYTNSMSHNQKLPNMSSMSISSLASQLTGNHPLPGDKLRLASNQLHSKSTVAGGITDLPGNKSNVASVDQKNTSQQRQQLVSGATSTIQDDSTLQQLSTNYDLSNVTFLHNIFQSILTTHCIARTLIFLPTTTSTMEVAKLEAMRGALHGIYKYNMINTLNSYINSDIV